MLGEKFSEMANILIDTHGACCNTKETIRRIVISFAPTSDKGAH